MATLQHWWGSGTGTSTKSSGSSSTVTSCLVHTTEEWQELKDYIPAKGEIVVFSDVDSYGALVSPRIKVGDGSAYVVDLPFVNGAIYWQFMSHYNNDNVHVTPADKIAWGNKVSCRMDDDGTLVFYT